MMRPEKEKTVSFRISQDAWNEIEKRAMKTGESAHQWARSALLEKLGPNDQFTPGERLLFEQFVRAQYLVTQGFQLLADHNLTGEQWRKFRAIANERASELAETALAMHAERNGQDQEHYA